MYSKSELPQAKAFKCWVTKEVLPSMRKTGGYELETTKKQLALKDEELAFFMALINHKKFSPLVARQSLDKTDYIHFL